MLDKDLLKYLGKKKALLVYIIIANIIGLALSVLTTGSFVFSLKYFINGDYAWGGYLLLIAIAFGVCKIGCTILANTLSNHLADFVSKKLRHETYEKYLALEGKTPFSTSEMAQLSTEGIEQLRLYYSSYIPSFFYAMIAPILLFILFMFIDMNVAFLYLGCVPLIPISIISVSKFAKRIFAKYWDQYIGLGNSFLDNTQGMKELKIFKYDRIRQKEMEDESEGFRKITMKVLVMQLASVTIMDLVAFGGAGIGIVLSLLSMQNGLDVYLTIFMILIGAEFFLPMRALGSAFHVAMNGATAGRKIMTLLRLDELNEGKEVLDHIDNVEMKNVSFSYIKDNEVLKDIDLKFNKGLYSLVGLSGSGKSTIAKLFSNIISPNEGEILINGKPLSTYTLSSFHAHVAYINANTYIFHQSIKDSFKFYNPTIDEKKMRQLLDKVELSHLDLDYVINDDFTNISGGEKQRLALALYLSREYDFYIFDEVTSNIDIESEEIILDIIKEISKNHVVMMISHRLKSTMYSDEVFYLENGKIILSGSYDNLTSQDNAFNALYQKQNELEVIK